MNAKDRSHCKALLGSLSDYLDGALEEKICQEIQRHLEECQDCRVVVDTLRKTIYLYHESAAGSADVPAQVRERLFRTLNLEDFIKD